MTDRRSDDFSLGEAGTASPGDTGIAPPMRNGEVVFEAPWQGRVFGMARAMAEAGVFEWDDFRAQLIEALRDRRATEPFDYYRSFLAALERLVTARGLVAADILDARFDALTRRPPGHDHHHHGGD